ncbi:J domain-containing protein [Planctomyces sp. SH-PL62]|uniref:J domain-containing protein n=1 Tax=Planctomyces sp. SH-PL62 TaxID=1636152 RepID=UPI00078CA8A5|nr:DnaJ domain-containing protein [Planctomyces sp. SH-PL62]AMV37854.1 Chaperone protein DnaJ [Planctomyces sp. SH-PL62]
MIHHFPFDPRVILGVPAEASPDEVREAYREKSKKHHPDLGGDEWAFRMVVRAYEVLKSTAGGFEPEASATSPFAPTQAAGASTWAEPPPWSRAAAASDFFSQGRFPFGGGGETATSPPETTPESESPPEPAQAEPPGVFQTVEVELVWIRFEMAEKSEHDLPGAAPADSSEGPTLSVCMVVSWPLRSLVSRTAEYANLGETLRHVIDAFDGLPASHTLAVRSRIEDGQFVGWASFPDVVAAQAGFLALRESLHTHDLTVHLQTRDEIIPPSWAR